jgi:hypothetical protein
MDNMNVDTGSVDRAPPVDDRDLDRGVEDRGSDRDRGRDREPQRPVSVRESLKRSFEDARRDEPDDEPDDRQLRTREPEEPTDTEPVETPEGEEQERTEPRARAESQAAPSAWDKVAKAEWANLPEKVKAAVIKREKDVEKGVQSLKNQYAEVDQAIAPYQQTIRQFNKTPGQAVGQLFAWFDALAKDPDQAFPALLQSYRYDPRRLMASYGIDLDKVIQVHQWMQQQQQGQSQQTQNGQYQQGQPQQEEQISPAVQAYINRLEERLNGFQNQVGQTFNGLAQNFQEQQQAKTQEMLETWAQGKPHFEAVRVMMGHLLTPDPNTGQAAIPLKDGRVDLDAAYDAAVHANPEIRAQVWADQQAQAEAARQAKQAEALKAQQDKVSKARRAAGSVTSSAPGAEVSRRQVPSKGLSVRESLKAAIGELSDR